MDVLQLDILLLLSVGCLVGDLVGLDGSFVGIFVGLFTFIVGENLGHRAVNSEVRFFGRVPERSWITRLRKCGDIVLH